MPLFAKQQIPISTKDILSFCHDGLTEANQDTARYVDCVQPAGEGTVSAKDAFSLIRKIIAGLRAAGLRKGDVVCTHSFNRLHYPILVQGIIGAGGIWVGTNPSYTAFELSHALKTSQAKFIVVEPEIIGAVETAAAEVGVQPSNIFLFADERVPGLPQYPTWRALLEHGEQDWERFDDLDTAKNTTAFLLFSSGTTGLPKAAQLSHYNLVAEHTLVHDNPEAPENYAMSRVVCLPMFHAAVAPFTFVTSLRSARTVYVMRRWHLEDFLLNVERFGATNVMVVPPMVVAIVQLGQVQPELVKRRLRSVRAAVAGAAPLDKVTQASLQKLLPAGSPFTQVWAMSETIRIASLLYHPEHDDTGSAGRMAPNIDVKLVDEGEREINPPYDTRGELCIRGPTVIRGYLNNPEANSRDWDAEGFFHTGDIVICDGKTKLWYVVDRRKELIKVRGFQVAPSELEGVLLGHPAIRDVAVIGVSAGEAGELPRAYIVKGDGPAGKALTVDDVMTFMDGKLSKYKRLEGGVRFVESIPKTASGKILKRVLREQAKGETVWSRL